MIHKLDAVDTFVADAFQVQSDKVTYSTDHIHAEYEYQSTSVETRDGKITVVPKTDCFDKPPIFEQRQHPCRLCMRGRRALANGRGKGYKFALRERARVGQR